METMMEIKLVRLSTGEELVCEYEYSPHLAKHKVRNAFIIIPTGDGKISFLPYMPYSNAKDGFQISDNFVMWVVDPADQLRDHVKEQIGSIITPDKKIIL